MCLAVLASLLFTRCSKDKEEVDTVYPEIDLSVAGAFPRQCSSIQRGQAFTFKARFSDNAELGSYSLDVHHNFDHHSHSTEVEECDLEAKKTPVQPFLFIKDYAITAGLQEYVATVEISVPADADPGDYHFMVRLTDKEGWQTMKGLSIKITD
ncbi:uncharacterized protein DUF4625 [Chitinophaga japonensis]|uniref:Uncharacterized protein DUF4625 n=2 Tax=Chitinophaga japonensis TaxID=104662 RepID=A0A562ST44_CHIJA|nr:uncharacterized protein DUF4625 [Chitinophaga japonensis]